jgi:hypothetical protein
MKTLRWYIFMFLTGMLISACASAPSQVASPTLTIPAPVTEPVQSATAGAPQPVALATSRGDKLEASPPDSVEIGAGRPVLVEFFRFT